MPSIPHLGSRRNGCDIFDDTTSQRLVHASPIVFSTQQGKPDTAYRWGVPFLASIPIRLMRENGDEAVRPSNVLTISRAAELLNVRCEFMVKLLDDKTIPSAGVGGDVGLRNLCCWPASAARHEAIWQMARDAVESGVYDLVILPEGAEDE
jgi:hypothetical protein